MQFTKRSLLQSLPFLIISLFIASFFLKTPENYNQNIMEESSVAEVTVAPENVREIHGVKIEKNPSQSKLHLLSISSWPTWKGQPSKFPWTFEATETMYLLEGKVIVSVDGHEETFEIGAGDLVVFPKGMKITWDMLEAVSKHYSLEK